MIYFPLNEFLFATLLCYSSIVITSGMSHPPLIVAPDPNANALFLKKAELEPAATGTHASEGKHAKHGDGKIHHSGKADGEGYHKTSGYEENLGYQKKDKGNFGVQGTSGHSTGGGRNYGGGHHKSKGSQGFKTLEGKSHGGGAGDSFHDVHQDSDKKFKEFMASLQADSSFKSFSHGDHKGYGDSYDNVEGFHKGDKGSFSKSDGYKGKEGHDNSGGEKFVEKGEYNDEYEHKDGKFGNAKYGEHKHKSGKKDGHKSVQGGKGGSSDKYDKKSEHGNLRGHKDHASHHDHHSSAHEGGHGTSHSNGNVHHGNYQGVNHHGKHHSEEQNGGKYHNAGHHGGKQGGHQHEGNLANHHKSEYHAGGAVHHGAKHNGGHQASNVAHHVPVIPVYNPHLTPPGTTVAPHPIITATHSGKASVHNNGYIQTLANTGVAVSHLGVPVSSIIVHEGGVIQHGTHLGIPLSPIVESAQDSQMQPIIATVDDNIVSSSVVHTSYESGSEEARPESNYETENEGEIKEQNGQIENNKNPSHSGEVNRGYNGEEETESGQERDGTSNHNGRSVYEKQENEPSKESTPIIKTLEHNHGINPDYEGIETTSHAQGELYTPSEDGSTNFEHNTKVKPSKYQDGSENSENGERRIESVHQNNMPQEYEPEMSPKHIENYQKENNFNGGQDKINEEVAGHKSYSNIELKSFKDVHSSIGRDGTLHHHKRQDGYSDVEEKGSDPKDVRVSQKQVSGDYEPDSAKTNEDHLRNTEKNCENNGDKYMKTHESEGKELALNEDVEAQGENQGNGNSEMEPQQEQHVRKPENFESMISEVKIESKSVVDPSNEKLSNVESQIESSSNQKNNLETESKNYEQVEQEAENEEAREASESIP